MTDLNEIEYEYPINRSGNLLSFLKEVWQTVILSLIVFAVINFATVRIRVQSISMQPTLYERDFVLVNKLAYQIGSLQRRDVVVFQPPIESEKEPYIKRVIGLPGDVVRVTDGVVYINDLPLQEAYEAAPPIYQGVWTVPEDQVFVLGDNRNNSSDSHIWGMVPVDNIIGKAVVVYWPFEHWKTLDPATASAAGQ
jgi:signal peptidase I